MSAPAGSSSETREATSGARCSDRLPVVPRHHPNIVGRQKRVNGHRAAAVLGDVHAALAHDVDGVGAGGVPGHGPGAGAGDFEAVVRRFLGVQPRRSASMLLARPAAMGLRQMLPVQTRRMRVCASRSSRRAVIAPSRRTS